MNGNGELTETENVIFLRKLRSSYRILTDERNSYVLCYRYGNGCGNGYGVLEFRHYPSISRSSVVLQLVRYNDNAKDNQCLCITTGVFSKILNLGYVK